MFTKIKLFLLGVLVLYCMVATATCSYKSSQVRALKSEKEIAALEHKAKISELKADAKTIEAKWAQSESKAYERYAKDIQDLNAMYIERMRDVNGVQHITTETIKYLPDYTREALEKYATATGNGVSECSALLVETENIARQYDAEIERIISSYPDPVEEVEPHKLE